MGKSWHGDNLVTVSGDEFVRKLLEGERDFRNIRIPAGFDLRGHDAFGELNSYFRERYKGGIRNFNHSDRVDISGSKILSMNANHLYMPYLNARRSNLSLSEFHGSYLSCSDFYEAELTAVKMNSARVRSCIFIKAYMPWADLGDIRGRNSLFDFARLPDAKITGANLPYTFWNGAEFSDMTSFDQSVLTEADFTGASINSARYAHTNLNRAKFRKLKNAGCPYFQGAFMKDAEIDENVRNRFLGTGDADVSGSSLDPEYTPPSKYLSGRPPVRYHSINTETGKREYTDTDPHLEYKVEMLIELWKFMRP